MALSLVSLLIALMPLMEQGSLLAFQGAGTDDIAATQTASIAITQPVPGASVTSPLTVRGVERAPGGLASVSVRLVSAATNAAIATTDVPVQQSASGGSFAATLIFDAPPTASPGRVEVAAVGGDTLASTDVSISGPLAAPPVIVVTSPPPGVTVAGPTIPVQGLETGGGYPGPITVRLVNRLNGAVLAAADTGVQREQPGAVGNWSVSLTIARPPERITAQIEVLVVFPGTSVQQIVARVDVTVAGYISGGQQVAVTTPAPNATVTSPLTVNGLFTEPVPDGSFIVRLRDQTAQALLASELAVVQPPGNGQPGAFTARLNFNVPANGDNGLIEIVIPAGPSGAASETVVATVPVRIGAS